MVKHVNTLRRNYKNPAFPHLQEASQGTHKESHSHLSLWLSQSYRLFDAQKHSSERKTRYRPNSEN